MINSSEETKFQFHKGTIKTGEAGNRKAFQGTFQFHKGTIKTKLTR